MKKFHRKLATEDSVQYNTQVEKHFLISAEYDAGMRDRKTEEVKDAMISAAEQMESDQDRVPAKTDDR